jgi:NADH-quinone oxidoreductase subunit C
VPDGERAASRLAERFPDAVVRAGAFREQHWVEVKPERLVEVCGWLREEPALAYDFLVDVTAVHWPDDALPIELVYHLYSTSQNDRLRLKARLGDGAPAPSVSRIWRAAEWNERETYDMFGLRFDGHPDLRRILMPEDYTDHPLRKEFPLYRG